MSALPPLYIPTVSLGRVSAGHKLLAKLHVAAQYGYAGVEVTFECLEDLASSTGEPSVPREERLRAAAANVKRIADKLCLDIAVLSPFVTYEGCNDPLFREQRFQEATLWLELASILGATVMQLPSNVLEREQCTDDLPTIVSDFQRLADAAAKYKPAIRIAYENLEWGTYVKTWQDAWNIILAVDRPNFGLCFDVFHIAGLLYGDPTVTGGRRVDGERALESSMAEFEATVDINKVFLYQLSDGHLMDPPLGKPGNAFYDPSQRPGLTWSRNGRPFPFQDGYLAILRIARTMVRLGYHGITSMEVFVPRHHDKDDAVPTEMAAQGMQSWNLLQGGLADLS